jgi:uncharacterized protein (TIGR00255 family)
MELRSVNGRYLEVKIRQPFGASVESRLRKRLERAFGRGRVDLSVSYQASSGGELESFGVAAEDVASVVEALRSVADVAPQLGQPNQLEVLEFLIRRASKSGPAEPEGQLLESVLDDAVRAASAMRHEEGRHLHGVLSELAAQLQDEVRAIESSLIGESERLHANLVSRFEELLQRSDGEVDDQRVAQELALLLQKGDVSEELARLESHFSQWSSVLAEDASAGQGKRLDFLTQELLREVTTIGSKITAHLGSARVIEAKAIIERMREQVQNVE